MEHEVGGEHSAVEGQSAVLVVPLPWERMAVVRRRGGRLHAVHLQEVERAHQRREVAQDVEEGQETTEDCDRFG